MNLWRKKTSPRALERYAALDRRFFQRRPKPGLDPPIEAAGCGLLAIEDLAPELEDCLPGADPLGPTFTHFLVLSLLVHLGLILILALNPFNFQAPWSPSPRVTLMTTLVALTPPGQGGVETGNLEGEKGGPVGQASESNRTPVGDGSLGRGLEGGTGWSDRTEGLEPFEPDLRPRPAPAAAVPAEPRPTVAELPAKPPPETKPAAPPARLSAVKPAPAVPSPATRAPGPAAGLSSGGGRAGPGSSDFSGSGPGGGGGGTGPGGPGQGVAGGQGSGTWTPPRALNQPRPSYPLPARRRGIEGWVKVRFLVQATGAAESLELIEASPPGVFEEAVRQAFPSWTFHPGLRDGQPVNAWVVTTIHFRLTDN
ncbi:MAG: TonB family protein [Thermodesulfobacteriota bacterium]